MQKYASCSPFLRGQDCACCVCNLVRGSGVETDTHILAHTVAHEHIHIHPETRRERVKGGGLWRDVRAREGERREKEGGDGGVREGGRGGGRSERVEGFCEADNTLLEDSCQIGVSSAMLRPIDEAVMGDLSVT